MTPTADQSAAILAAKLRRQEPFSFWRFGDGFLECAVGRSGMTCDRESYSAPLRDGLLQVWSTLTTCAAEDDGGAGDPIYFGDWQAASFIGPHDRSRWLEEWREFFGSVARDRFLHPEALLFMRESEALVDFWRAVKEDPRRKLYFGEQNNLGAAKMLGADFLPCTMNLTPGDANLYEIALTHGNDFTKSPRDWEILIFGAGLAGMIPVFRAWQAHPDRTYLHVGSALDPLGRGKSRKQQLPADKIRRMMRGVL